MPLEDQQDVLTSPEVSDRASSLSTRMQCRSDLASATPACDGTYGIGDKADSDRHYPSSVSTTSGLIPG